MGPLSFARDLAGAEIQARQRRAERAGSWHMVFMFLQMLVGNPDIVPVFSTATWTVRSTATGTVRKVTARSRQEAKEKIANNVFDED
jgi:hypothetical protein